MRLPRLRRKRLPEQGVVRPRRRLQRPRVRRPRVPAGRLTRPRLPSELGFRITTRVKALGYGLREKAWELARRWDRFEARLRAAWRDQSPQARKRILAVVGVVVLYLLIKFVSLPGVPCEISGVKECPPGDDAVALVPSGALVYAHLTLDKGTAQYDRAGDVFRRFSRFSELGQTALGFFHAPSGAQITFADIRPWAGKDAAATILPAGPKGAARASAVMIAVNDQKGAQQFLTKVIATKPTPGVQNGVKLSAYPGGFDSAIANGFLLLGADPVVRQLIATGAGKQTSLANDPTVTAIRDRLPGNRFADVYVSGIGARSLLAPNTSTAVTQLGTFVDYAATKGFAAAAVARDDGIELDLTSGLDKTQEAKSPSLLTQLPKFHPDLTNSVGSRALGYVGIGDAGKSLGALLQRAASAQPGLAQALTGFTQRLQAQAKVDPTKDLLPALGGQAALVAEPTSGIPYASLIVSGVDESKAKSAMARLQGPILSAAQPPSGQPLAGFTSTKVAGVDASELQVSPAVDLTYAIFDGKLVVSTQPTGIEQVKKGTGERLSTADVFTKATRPLPDELSALAFFNLDELLNLAEALGRVEDPLYASFRDDIRKLHALAVGVTAEASELRSRLFVTIK